MTRRETREDVSLRTREGDGGRCNRLRAFWRKWGELIRGVSLLSACIACIAYAPLMYHLASEQTHNAQATAKAARQSCERSRALGPSLLKDYEVRQVLTGPRLELYRSLIPTTCPSKP